MYFFAIQKNLSFISLIQTIYDFHQGGFTGTVFTDNRMYSSFTQGNIYIVKSLHTRKAFTYSPQL